MGRLTVNWTRANKKTDGGDLPPEEITGYRIYYGRTGLDLLRTYKQVPPEPLTAVLEGLIEGERYMVQMTTLAGNEESDRTNMVSGVAGPPAPQAPASVTLSVKGEKVNFESEGACAVDGVPSGSSGSVSVTPGQTVTAECSK